MACAERKRIAAEGDADTSSNIVERRKAEEDDDDEKLSDEEGRNRWKRQWLKRVAEKATKKLEKGRKVDKGFEAAFASGENTHKFIRRHEFKYAAEPKDKVPESKPPGKPGEYFTEPSKWMPPKHTEEYPARKDRTETLQIPEKPIDEHGRREAERAERTDGKDKDDFREADALLKDDLALETEKEKDDYPAELVTTLDIETPASSAQDVTSRIVSGMEKAGYGHVSTETNIPDYTFEPSFLEDELEKAESAAREDSISPLELSDINETLRQHEIENVLEEQRQEMMQDFEIQPRIHDDIAGLTEAGGHVREALEASLIGPVDTSPIESPLKPKVEVEDAEME